MIQSYQMGVIEKQNDEFLCLFCGEVSIGIKGIERKILYEKLLQSASDYSGETIIEFGKRKNVSVFHLLNHEQEAIENFCHNSEEDVQPIDNVLNGIEFCVRTSSQNLPSVDDLKLLLKLHGASMTEFPRKKKTFAVVAGDIDETN
ncbi:hypothetical protein PVAND_007407 [Polypedilum vanderplanki]|uniref:Uncharacterized protein n=1 Tax=Polypedilum vanderplanki TaxID=319348 RepID=A0A9J6C7Q5_POLVA|nr:hypothetical protein PVAND_007407 [Polypedilum vanderplanki]